MTYTCERCGKPATHVDSVLDATVRGYSPSEAGYRDGYFCELHAAVRERGVGTSRLMRLDDAVVIPTR